MISEAGADGPVDYQLGNGKRSSLAVPQHIPQLISRSSGDIAAAAKEAGLSSGTVSALRRRWGTGSVCAALRAGSAKEIPTSEAIADVLALANAALAPTTASEQDGRV
jgi:hypothetical protein